MNFLQQTSICIALGCLLAPASVQAQQIRQPASILPWNSPKTDKPVTIVTPKSSNPTDSPAWLIETAEKPFHHASIRNKLPNVESQSPVLLGQIRSGSAQIGHSSQGLLRYPSSIGIQAARTNRRR